MMLAVVPLIWLPPRQARAPALQQSTADELLRALTDSAYRRLLVYSCGFAVANGITGAAQSMYPFRVLGIEYGQMVGPRT